MTAELLHFLYLRKKIKTWERRVKESNDHDLVHSESNSYHEHTGWRKTKMQIGTENKRTPGYLK